MVFNMHIHNYSLIMLISNNTNNNILFCINRVYSICYSIYSIH